MKSYQRLTIAFHAMAIACLCSTAIAQEYPTRPITLIAPNNPGTNPDTVARIMAQDMSKILGQPIIVENKASANGLIGYAQAAKAAPDGYTIVAASVNELAALGVTVKDPPFDPLRDIPPFVGLAEGRNILGSASKFPWKTFAELVAYAKANPGKLNYGSPGANVRIPMEFLLYRAGIDVFYVPYSGGGAVLAALASGEVHMSTLGEASVMNIGERLRVLAVTGDSRAAPFIDVPTFKELGYPEIPSLAYSLNAPRGIQKATMDKLYGAAARSLQQDDVRARFAKVGMTTMGESPEAAARRLSDVGKLFTDTAKRIGITPQ